MTNWFPFSRFTVSGNSMFPTLKMGQDVLVFRWAYFFRKPKVGDIVVIKEDGKEMVKRVHLSSDRGIFVQGDNEKDSLDSRKFGFIKKEQILGKVIYIAR